MHIADGGRHLGGLTRAAVDARAGAHNGLPGGTALRGLLASPCQFPELPDQTTELGPNARFKRNAPTAPYRFAFLGHTAHPRVEPGERFASFLQMRQTEWTQTSLRSQTPASDPQKFACGQSNSTKTEFQPRGGRDFDGSLQWRREGARGTYFRCDRKNYNAVNAVHVHIFRDIAAWFHRDGGGVRRYPTLRWIRLRGAPLPGFV
jgi:hypothetical protein